MEQQKKQATNVQALPEEMLADVLRRLAPRSLAVSRSVCKAWRAVVDDRRLLRPELLPRTLGGVFIDFYMLARPEFFAAAAAVSGDLSFTGATPRGRIIDHCNGLLLRLTDVVNAATRQWAPLPPRPPPRMSTKAFITDPYLVFDPAISPHYEVFLMPGVARWANLDEAMARSEWPPPLCETHVFSSRTGRWEERSFVREGQPAGTIADMTKTFVAMDKRYSVYWRGALYVHCRNDFICKVSMAGSKYQVIDPPAENDPDYPHAPYLGRSEKGVYCAILDRELRLRVWILDESSGRMEWVIRHQTHLGSVLASQDSYQRGDDGVCWCFKDINHYADNPEDDGDHQEPTEQHQLTKHSNFITLLGLHPFKEIVYLNSDFRSGLAYDLNTSKVQDLGNMYPKYYNHIAGPYACIQASFPYTPSWMENSFY